MKKRIWRDGKYREYVVSLLLTEEDALSLKTELLNYLCQLDLNPDSGWKENYKWAYDIVELINHQLSVSKISFKTPLEAGKISSLKKLSEWLKKEYGLEPLLGNFDTENGNWGDN